MVDYRGLEFRSLLFGAMLAIGATGLCGCPRSPEVGTAERPLRWQLFPGHRDPLALEAMKRIERRLADKLGMKVQLSQPTDYAKALDRIVTGKEDLALLNALGLFLAQQQAAVQVFLRVTRSGGRDDHRGQILVARSGSLSTPQDLKGTRIAMVDPYSLTGFVLPSMLLQTNKIKPGTISFVGSHAEALRQLATGKVDAATCYLDERTGPGVPADLVDVLAASNIRATDLQPLMLTRSVPNEPLVARAGLGKDLVARATAAIKELGLEPETRHALGTLGAIDGFVDANNEDYSELRTRVAAASLELSRQVPGGWKLDIQAAGKLR